MPQVVADRRATHSKPARNTPAPGGGAPWRTSGGRLTHRRQDAVRNRTEIDPKVLVANPPLWRVLDEDARTNMARGTLCCGERALRQMAVRVDGETARRVFKISGLD
ncbi:hypothetical protein [Streptomyces sp. NPDC023838]|uniref:hypothetical protein n=1 Tax=Streptomyces sp. NPDC023838 TaxID=3154325 RepID=UPI003411666A